MPRMRTTGLPQHVQPGVEVYIVTVDREADMRTLMRVEGATLTVTREDDDVAWWRDEVLVNPPTRMSVVLEGVLGDPHPYTGPLPDERPAVAPPTRAIGGASPIALGPGR